MNPDVTIDAQAVIDAQAQVIGQLHTQLIVAQQTNAVLRQRLAELHDAKTGEDQ